MIYLALFFLGFMVGYVVGLIHMASVVSGLFGGRE